MLKVGVLGAGHLGKIHLKLLKQSTKYDLVGFYDLHVIGKKYKLEPKKMDLMLKKLKGTRTHFSLYGIKTEKSIKEILKIIKNKKK